MENKHLGLAHVRIPFADVMAQRANVRGYIYRLLASDTAAARANLDFINEASNDEEADARANLAQGLRDTYFDGLEEVVVSWILEEDDTRVNGYLLEHMAIQSIHMSRYEDFVEQAYRAEAPGSAARARLEAAASGTSLANKLGRIRILGDNADFLQIGGGDVSNFTFNGPATGAFSGSGSASAGDISTVYQIQAPTIASAELSKLIDLLSDSNSTEAIGKAEASKAAQAPTRGAVQDVLDWFRVAREGGQLASATVAAAPQIVDTLQKLLPHLP